jgi:hypothetical protein
MQTSTQNNTVEKICVPAKWDYFELKYYYAKSFGTQSTQNSSIFQEPQNIF